MDFIDRLLVACSNGDSLADLDWFSSDHPLGEAFDFSSQH
jgi:hypothetical protein